LTENENIIAIASCRDPRKLTKQQVKRVAILATPNVRRQQ